MSSLGRGGRGRGPRACCNRSIAPPSVGDEGCATPTSHLLVSLSPQTPGNPSARELELEDRQSRLQQELRERMAVEGRRGGAGRGRGRLGQAPCLRPAGDSPVWFCPDHLKTEEELAEEKRILNEMLEVVEQRDALVALLEEQRLREKEEDKDLEAAMLSKGFSLHWS